MTTSPKAMFSPDALRQRFTGGPLARPFLLMAGMGLIGSIIGLIVAGKHFLFAYLAAYAFGWTVVMGMMFLVLLHHVTDAGWSTVVRRIAEQFLAALPALAILFLPILLGMGWLYKWTGATVEKDPLMAVKSPFLNVPFFILRAVIYFAAWWLIARVLRGMSLKQDRTGDPKLSLAMRRWTPLLLILYALTFTFAAFDWLMALDHHWYSTIYGVLIYSGGTLTALALLSIMVPLLAKGPLEGYVARDHLHDLGKLIFAFAVFWAYIAFSQWFLIWYANIPEETGWLLTRWAGSWKVFTILMAAGMFAVPFMALMPAGVKTQPVWLISVGAVILFAHQVEMMWLVMPTLHKEGWSPGTVWIDLSAWLLVTGVLGAVIRAALLADSWIPVNDPRLKEVRHAVEHEAGHDVHEAGASPAVSG